MRILWMKKCFVFALILLAGIMYFSESPMIQRRQIMNILETPMGMVMSLSANYSNLPKVVPTAVNRTKSTSQVLVYNRVTKTASEFMRALLKKLAKRNNFGTGGREVNGPYGYFQRLNRNGEVKLIKHLAHPRLKPYVYIRHFWTLNWTDYESIVKVNLVNVVREPVSQFISRFYYCRGGGKISKYIEASWYNKTLENCVLSGNDSECQIGGSRVPFLGGRVIPLEMQLTYFCGQYEQCRNGSSRWALQQAMQMVESQYSVVGILEQLNMSLAVMETYLPAYFAGATNLLSQGMKKKNTNKRPHPEPSIEVLEAIRAELHLDIEFYNFIQQRLALQIENIGTRVE